MRSAMIAEFLTAADSERFSDKNDRLREGMEKGLAAHLGDELAESDTHLNYDWWPDHTRPVEISERAFTFASFEILRSLLTGEFDEWRIQAVVYTDIMEGTTFIGSVLIWSDKLIVRRELFDWMETHHFTFPSAHIRSFSLANDDLESVRSNLMNDPS
jgi:hypothetical protein